MTPEMEHRVALYDELVAAVWGSVRSASSDMRTVREPDDAARYVANMLVHHEPGRDLLRRLAAAFPSEQSDEIERSS